MKSSQASIGLLTLLITSFLPNLLPSLINLSSDTAAALSPSSTEPARWHGSRARPNTPRAPPSSAPARPTSLTAVCSIWAVHSWLNLGDGACAPCALQYRLIFGQHKKPYFLPCPGVCPGPLHPQLYTSMFYPTHFTSGCQSATSEKAFRQSDNAGGMCSSPKWAKATITIFLPPWFVSSNFPSSISEGAYSDSLMLICSVTPHHPISVSVSVSKLFKTFLGLCHPLWIRKSWCSDDLSRPHALTLSLPLLLAVTCTILLSLLQSDLHFHYHSQPGQYKSF